MKLLFDKTFRRAWSTRIVIASEAKQSRMSAKSKAAGSPRRFAPRDDGIVQRFLECLKHWHCGVYEAFQCTRT